MRLLLGKKWTFFELRFSLVGEGKEGKNLSSQTWPGNSRRPSPRHLRPPDKNPPKISKYHKKNAFTPTSSKNSPNFCLLRCDTSQEPDGNCSEKLAQMNFFILGRFLRLDSLPQIAYCLETEEEQHGS